MHDFDLFSAALGLEEPWRVVDVRFDAERRRLDLRIDFAKGARASDAEQELTLPRARREFATGGRRPGKATVQADPWRARRISPTMLSLRGAASEAPLLRRPSSRPACARR